MIRPYHPDDFKILVEILRRNTPKYFAQEEVQYFIDYIKEFPSTYFIIEENEKTVGGIGYQIDLENRTGKITWIFLSPDCAGKGLGKLGVNHCMKILGNSNEVKKNIVRTSQFAFRFFEGCGFQTKRIVPDYWSKGFDLYEMELSMI